MNQETGHILDRLPINRSTIFGVIITGALMAFELFNFSTTNFALHDLLGDLKFVGINWSAILAIAFCGIDFAGIARIFTPETGRDEPAEVWYLFGAWLIAATMNAMLTWWGVSIAILGNDTLGNVVLDKAALLKAVPLFVATLVWLSRLLLIGTFSLAGERLFTEQPASTGRHKQRRLPRAPQAPAGQPPAPARRRPQRPANAGANFRPNQGRADNRQQSSQDPYR